MIRIILCICLLGSNMSFAQSDEFFELKDRVIALVDEKDWAAVIELAPELVEADLERGEGDYYLALAHYNLKDHDKAMRHINRSNELADADLRRKLVLLYDQVKDAQDLKEQIKYIEELEDDGDIEEAAEAWLILWKKDKSIVSYAYKAAQHYINIKEYEKALDILLDKVFKYNTDIQKVIKDINKTPEMIAINGYNEAMENGEEYYDMSEFALAIEEFEKALEYKPDDYLAGQYIESAEDELAWQKAEEIHSIDSYRDYLNGYTILEHADEARTLIQNHLLTKGEEAAEKNDIPEMERQFNRYLEWYPEGNDVVKVKKTMCETYYRNGQIAAVEKTESSQDKAVVFYKSAKAICLDKPDIDKKIKKAENLAFRYSQPDLIQTMFVYDKISTYGFSFGNLNNTALGWYGTIRINDGIWTSADYTVDNAGTLSNKTLDLRRTEKNSNGNFEMMGGIAEKLFEPMYIYCGIGFSYNPVYWNYENHSNGYWKPAWAKNTDQTKTTPMIETGLILNVGGVLLRSGIKTPNFSDYIFTVGIGFTMKRD